MPDNVLYNILYILGFEVFIYLFKTLSDKCKSLLTQPDGHTNTPSIDLPDEENIYALKVRVIASQVLWVLRQSYCTISKVIMNVRNICTLGFIIHSWYTQWGRDVSIMDKGLDFEINCDSNQMKIEREIKGEPFGKYLQPLNPFYFWWFQ